jgi:hypothetical protein
MNGMDIDDNAVQKIFMNNVGYESWVSSIEKNEPLLTEKTI